MDTYTECMKRKIRNIYYNFKKKGKMFYNVQNINSFSNVLYSKDEMFIYLNNYRKYIIISM